MPIELAIALAVVFLAAIGWFVVQQRRKALPPSMPGRELPARGEVEPTVPEGDRAPLPEAPVPVTPEREEAVEEARPAEALTKPEAAPEVEPEPTEAEPEERPFTFAPPPLEGAKPAVPLPVDKPRTTEEVEQRRATARAEQRERYRTGLAKTRGGFVAKLAKLFKGRPKVDDDLRDDVEEVLFTADIGSRTAQKLLDRVTTELDSKDVADPDAVWTVIREASLEILDIPAPEPDFSPSVRPYVLLAIGVNGVGKTTTLGKLAALHARAGRKVLLVAGDTFRAAAVEQLEVWATRVGCAIHRGADKADPSSVIYEGIARGRREGFDVVLCDTAGRLHTRKELMDELGKVRRSATKALAAGVPSEQRDDVTGPHDTYLVLDATIGQNALAQATMFKETMDFTGLVITKLDGTAKGGVVLGICDEMKVPVRYIGVGEGIDDLRPFDAEDFADALLVDRDRAGESEEAAAGA